jgi:glycosyltransferase involved in cell wall biosynthesis
VENFRLAVSSWLAVNEISEIILVDWKSPIPIADILKVELTRFQGTGTVLQVLRGQNESNPEKSWRIGAAFNLALASVREDFVLKLDCDTWLHPDFIKANQLSKVGFRYGSYLNARDDNDLHLNGVFFARTAYVREVHGFDERLDMYGWDDSDLYQRLEEKVRSNFTVAYDDFVRHIHGASIITHLQHSRTADPTVEIAGICFNKDCISKAEHWNGMERNCYEERQRNVYDQIEVRELFLLHEALPIQQTLEISVCIKLALNCLNYAGAPPHEAARMCATTWEHINSLSLAQS